MPLTWVEISKSALKNNVQQFKNVIGLETLLSPCIKANAYGHGLIETARILESTSIDWFCVNSLQEAEKLRSSGIKIPILIIGYIPLESLETSIDFGFKFVIYNFETLEKLSEIANSKELNSKIKVHLKFESGLNRQGIHYHEIEKFLKKLQEISAIEVEGAYTHFANVEDTTDHSFAEKQLKNFHNSIARAESIIGKIPVKHSANSAATISFPKSHLNLVRTGISTYGLWPSKETYISYIEHTKEKIHLKPVLTWKTKIAQIKTIPSGEFIGYGCTYRTTHKTKIAILPVGYYDGYVRSTQNAHVLINGKRAPIRGRIAMNMIVVDVTDIENLSIEDDVILLGKSGSESITAEDLASWSGTINYEVTTRINESLSRIIVD